MKQFDDGCIVDRLLTKSVITDHLGAYRNKKMTPEARSGVIFLSV